MVKVHVSVASSAVDWRAAVGAISLLPGRVAVEMHPLRESLGGVLLTDRRKEVVRPMVATVLAVGRSDDRRNPITLSAGDVVVCHPQDGKRIRGFAAGPYRANGEVRVFGIVAKHLGVPVRVPWHESVLGVVMNGRLFATGKNVLLRLQEKADASAGGILLPDGQKDRPDVGQIASFGPACSNLARVADVGDWVLYERRALKVLSVEGDESLALIEEDGIYGKVPPEVA
jgi:co-chaperonin GroES (HSP10)